MAIERYIKNYINGTLMPAISGDYLDNINPATGKVYSQYPDCDEADLEQAIHFAEKVLIEWRTIESERRFRILMRVADIIEQNAVEYARAESIDTGKPMSMSISQDIPGAQAYFRYYASSIAHNNSGGIHRQKNGLMNYRIQSALGIVGCILSCHMPILSLCRKVAPALAMGNCVVVKPSEYTPMTAYLLARDLEHAGLPKGVLSIVQGKDEKLIDAIVQHPKIKAISFAGEVTIGEKIIHQTASQHKKLSINIGGNNANIVFADCNFDQMMIATLRSSYSNNGQRQHHASRILVERSLYEKLKQELVKRTQFLKIGDPFAQLTDLGSLISEDHLEKVKSRLALVEVEGGTILCGGKPVAMEGELEQGYFMRPAVVEGLPNDSPINQAPIFGPIVSLQIFDTEEEAFALANATEYGLSATIWTQNISKANRVAEHINARTIWINSWLTENKDLQGGGIFGSGYPNEGGMASLSFFSEHKEVCLKY